MSKLQYTVRAVPFEIIIALRKQAKRTGKSLNQTTIEALAKGVGITPNTSFDDLDWFIGKKSMDAQSFDKALLWLNTLPKEERGTI